jgi:hypothetical protein
MFHLRFLSIVKTAEFEVRHLYADIKMDKSLVALTIQLDLKGIGGRCLRTNGISPAASHWHLSMAADQPIDWTFALKQVIVLIALLVPLHSLSMLPAAQTCPPPQDTDPD